MADQDLERLRAERLAQLQSKQNGSGAGPGGDQQAKEEEQKARQEEMKNSILSQVLSQEARARLSTIAVAKPSKAVLVENMLVNMARMGQIGGKLSEEQLIALLERVSEQTEKKTTVKFDRRRAAVDSDDD